MSTSSGESRSRITLAAGMGGTSGASPAPRGSCRSETSWEVVMSALALPAHPFFAVRAALFLPDRNRFLDAIDHHPAGGERLRAMGRSSANGDGRIADEEMTEPVDDGNGDVRECRPHLVDNFLDLLLRHRPVGIIENRFDRLPFVVIADNALEQHVRAVGRAHDTSYQCLAVDRIISQIRDASPP